MATRGANAGPEATIEPGASPGTPPPCASEGSSSQGVTVRPACAAVSDPENDEFFRQIFESSADGMMLTAPDGRTFRANSAACALLRRTEAELQQVGRAGVLDTSQSTAEEMLELRRQTGRVRHEVSLRRGDGTTFPCEVSSTTYVNAHGEERAVVTLRDITARRLAESELREGKEQLRLALEGGDLGLWDWNVATGRLSVNARWCAMLGLTPGGAPATIDRWPSLVHPDDRPLLLRVNEKIIFNPTGRNFESEFRVRHADGHYIWILDKGAVVERDELGRPVRVVGTHMDITERKAAEAAEREAKARLRFALDAAELGDWSIDLRTNLLTRSPQHDRCFGYSEPVANWATDTFLAHVYAVDRERVDAAYRSALHGLSDFDVEFRVVWPDQSVHWLWMKGRFYFDAHGKPYRVAGIVADISRRRRADDLQRETATRLRLATEASNTGLWDWDLRTNDVYYSPTWKRQLGYEEFEIEDTYKSWKNLLHPEDVESALATANAFVKDPGPHYESEFRLRHKDGSYRWMLSKAALIRDAEGRPVRLLGSHIDLTERKATEARTYEIERRFRTAIEAAPIPISLTDANEGVEYINSQFLKTLGYTLEDVKSVADWWPLAFPDLEYRAWVQSQWQTNLQAAVESGGNPAPIEANIRCKDGTIRTMVSHVAQLDGSDRPKRLAMFIDVTEQRLLERQLMQAVTREQHRLGMNLHDGLGQELTALSLLLTAAARTLARADPGTIERELKRLADVSGRCLATARAIAHGLSPIEPEPGGFERALERLAESTNRSGGAQVDLEFADLVSGPYVDPAIAEPLFRIVQEALTNAIRHGKATRIHIRLEGERSHLRISVADNGSGLIVDAPTPGFGLRIMRYRAQSVGGHISIERRAEGGTVINCVVPLQSAFGQPADYR